jgi:hypothetical protein
MTDSQLIYLANWRNAAGDDTLLFQNARGEPHIVTLTANGATTLTSEETRAIEAVDAFYDELHEHLRANQPEST